MNVIAFTQSVIFSMLRCINNMDCLEKESEVEQPRAFALESIEKFSTFAVPAKEQAYYDLLP